MSLKKIELPPHAHEIDDALDDMESHIDWLGRLTPTNLDNVWQGLCDSSFKDAPPFEYTPLPEDLSETRERLLSLHIHDVVNPLYEALLIEKQRELDRQIELVRMRDKPGFVLASLDLFGNVADRLLDSAREIRDNVPVCEPEPRDSDADAVIAVARDELRWYSDRCERFAHTVVKDPNPGTQLATFQGNLHVACDYEVPTARIIPLLQHEIGTHSLTRHNGRMQPLQVLECGLADYDRLQEGLAVLAEYLCGYLPPERLRILAARVEAAHMAVEEKTLAEIFAALHEDYRLDEYAAFQTAARAKRGGGLTKDALYLRGLIELLAYLGHDGDFEILFIGKFALKQLHTLEKMLDEGLLHPPDILPRYLEKPRARERLRLVRKLDVTQLYQETPEQ